MGFFVVGRIQMVGEIENGIKIGLLEWLEIAWSKEIEEYGYLRKMDFHVNFVSI